MNKSFYHFMMKYRNEVTKSELSMLANAMYHDIAFPKQSIDYDEISNYLELHVSYITDMTLFDEVWEMYKEDVK